MLFSFCEVATLTLKFLSGFIWLHSKGSWWQHHSFSLNRIPVPDFKRSIKWLSHLWLLLCRQRALEGLGHDAFDLHAGAVLHTHGAIPLDAVIWLGGVQPRQLVLTHVERRRRPDELRAEVTWGLNNDIETLVIILFCFRRSFIHGWRSTLVTMATCVPALKGDLVFREPSIVSQDMNSNEL